VNNTVAYEILVFSNNKLTIDNKSVQADCRVLTRFSNFEISVYTMHII